MAGWYKDNLKDIDEVVAQPQMEWAQNVYWMNNVVVDEKVDISRDEIMDKLRDAKIETRPFFYPMHTLPMYKKNSKGRAFPVADRLSEKGISLPSSATLTREEVDYVCEKLVKIIHWKN